MTDGVVVKVTSVDNYQVQRDYKYDAALLVAMNARCFAVEHPAIEGSKDIT